MKIKIIQVGKMRNKNLQAMMEEFLKRLRPFAKIEIVTIKESSPSKTVTPKKCVEEEGQRINKHLEGFVVALDETGNEMTSREFAGFLRKFETSGKTVCFVIGGAYGLSEKVKTDAGALFALARLTFTHEMAAVFLLEQIYRGVCILKGKAYHN